MQALNKYFDHTLLKPEATCGDILKLCEEALDGDFYSVCVNSSYVELAASKLNNSDVKIAAVVSFPLGSSTTATKVFETVEACRSGASEIDMVINVGRLKNADYSYVLNDIRAVVEAADNYHASVKVIIETCLLNDDEKVKACQLAVEANAHFVKTSTGFNTGGATVHDIRLMKAAVGKSAKVKASGGIRDYETTLKMIDAGADRIGASATVEIMRESHRN